MAATSTEGDDLLRAVQLYRSLGFFDSFRELTNEDLAERLVDAYRAKTRGRGDLRRPSELRDLSLLALDTSRTWWEDMESDVFRGNEAYVRILNQWAAISRGNFRPERIAEQWHSDQGPIDVSFAVAGREITWSTDVVEWIDERLLDTINTLILPTGVQFQHFFTGDQSAFVVALTREERDAIARERPWNLDLSLDRY